MPAENVRVVYARGSGCYGCNGADTVSFDAALLSQATGRPVRVQLTRKDEMAWENFGFAVRDRPTGGFGCRGNIVAGTTSMVADARRAPGIQPARKCRHRFFSRIPPAAFSPRAPAPAPSAAFSNGTNNALTTSAAVSAVPAAEPGTIKSERVLSHSVASPFWTGPLRSPSRLQNTFAHESFLDELRAREGGSDGLPPPSPQRPSIN